MVYCFSCGTALVSELESAGSLRCHDCRDDHRPVRREHVSRGSRASAPGRSARPALTLVKTFPRLAAPPEPPPFAA